MCVHMSVEAGGWHQVSSSITVQADSLMSLRSLFWLFPLLWKFSVSTSQALVFLEATTDTGFLYMCPGDLRSNPNAWVASVSPAEPSQDQDMFGVFKFYMYVYMYTCMYIGMYLYLFVFALCCPQKHVTLSSVFFRLPEMHSVVVKCINLDLIVLKLLGFCIYENPQLLYLRIGSLLV